MSARNYDAPADLIEELDTRYYDWRLDGALVKRYIENGGSLTSPVFRLKTLPGYVLSATLEPKGEEDAFGQYMSVTLSIKNHRSGGHVPWEVQPRFSASLLDRRPNSDNHLTCHDDVDLYATDGTKTSFCRIVDFVSHKLMLKANTPYISSDGGMILRLAVNDFPT